MLDDIKAGEGHLLHGEEYRTLDLGFDIVDGIAGLDL